MKVMVKVRVEKRTPQSQSGHNNLVASFAYTKHIVGTGVVLFEVMFECFNGGRFFNMGGRLFHRRIVAGKKEFKLVCNRALG